VLSLTSVDVSIEDINNFFGPRLNKNGWKYDDCPYVEMVKLIKKIYCLVIEKNKICNKQLIVSFTKAIVPKSKGKHVNWVAFSLHLKKQKLVVRNAKQEVARIRASKMYYALVRKL
jgi:hypothetical protein